MLLPPPRSLFWDSVIPIATRELSSGMTSTVTRDLQKLATTEIPNSAATSLTGAFLVVLLSSMLSGPSCGSESSGGLFNFIWYIHYCLLF